VPGIARPSCPDGRVLIFGGVDARGHVRGSAEIFDPGRQTFAPVSTPNLNPRRRHTTSLLTRARVHTQEVTPEGTLNYTYDAANRRATMTVAGQTAVSYTYGNADRLASCSSSTCSCI